MKYCYCNGPTLLAQRHKDIRNVFSAPPKLGLNQFTDNKKTRVVFENAEN